MNLSISFVVQLIELVFASPAAFRDAEPCLSSRKVETKVVHESDFDLAVCLQLFPRTLRLLHDFVLNILKLWLELSVIDPDEHILILGSGQEQVFGCLESKASLGQSKHDPSENEEVDLNLTTEISEQIDDAVHTSLMDSLFRLQHDLSVEIVIWVRLTKLSLLHILGNFPKEALIGKLSDVHVVVGDLNVVLPELENVDWIGKVVEHIRPVELLLSPNRLADLPVQVHHVHHVVKSPRFNLYISHILVHLLLSGAFAQTSIQSLHIVAFSQRELHAFALFG